MKIIRATLPCQHLCSSLLLYDSKKSRTVQYRTHTEMALATPRRPCSPEGHRAWTRLQYASEALNGRPERILPGHLGPAGALRGGRHHGATILGLESDMGQPRGCERWHRPRTSSYSHLGCRLERRGAARRTIGAIPSCATHVRPLPKKKPVWRHRTQRAKARRVGRRRSLPAPPAAKTP